MVYKWRFIEYSVNAQIVGETIEKIEKAHGECTASLLLEEARSKKSILHSLFEWDDTIASEKYRLVQATKYLTALVTVYDDKKDNEPKVIRAFANVGAKNNGSFITMTKALSNKNSRQIVLKHALDELQSFKAKYQGLQEFINLFNEIDKLSV